MAKESPRYELVYEDKRSTKRLAKSFVRELRSLAARGSGRVGDVYALAARAVLNGVERFEDRNAERRFGRSVKRSPAVGAGAPRLASHSSSPKEVKG